MSAEYRPGDEYYKGWAYYVGHYAAMFACKIGELGAQACQVIARASMESDDTRVSADFQPNVAPALLTKRDEAHLELLYKHIEYPYQLDLAILEVQRHDSD